MSDRDDRSAIVIPLPWVTDPARQSTRDIANMVHNIGATLAELVATADAHGMAVPPSVRIAADLLNNEPVRAPGAWAARWWATGKDDVKRLEFLAAMLSAAAGVALPPEGLVEPGRLGRTDVDRWRRKLAWLYELDDQHGGAGGVYDVTIQSLGQMRRTLQRSSYETATGQALQSIVGAVAEHAGWLAYDAGWQAEARYWWLEALHTARLAENDEVSTVVLASMSLQASRAGHPSDAVDLAQAAQRAARSRTTPRLRSVLLAREGRGLASGRDGVAARRALHRASAELDRGRHDGDPSWLDFWGEADLACHEMNAAVDLGDLGAAEQAARAALASVDQAVYPRNHALYLIQLGDIVLARGDLDEAIPLAIQAVTRACDLDSGRVTGKVHALVRGLARHDGEPAVRDFLEWASPLLSPTATPRCAPQT